MKMRIVIAFCSIFLLKNSYSQDNRYYITIGTADPYYSTSGGSCAGFDFSNLWVGCYIIDGSSAPYRSPFNIQLTQQSFSVYNKPSTFYMSLSSGWGSGTSTEYKSGLGTFNMSLSQTNNTNCKAYLVSSVTVDDPILITSVTFVNPYPPFTENPNFYSCVSDNYMIKIVTAPFYNNSKGENRLQILNTLYYSYETISNVTLDPSGSTIYIPYSQISQFVAPGNPVRFQTSKKQTDGGFSYSKSPKSLTYYDNLKLGGVGTVEIIQPICEADSPQILIPSAVPDNFNIKLIGPFPSTQALIFKTGPLSNKVAYNGSYYIIDRTTISENLAGDKPSLSAGLYSIEIERSGIQCPYKNTFRIFQAPALRIVSTSFNFDQTDNVTQTKVQIANPGGFGRVNLTVDGSNSSIITITAGGYSRIDSLSMTYVVDGKIYYKGNSYIDLPVGTYSIQVSNGSCSSNIVDGIKLDQPSLISFDLTPTTISCDTSSISGNKNDGTITISNLSGGIGAYTISPNASSLGKGNYIIRDLSYIAGEHSVTVSDAHGNTTTKTIVVPQNSPLTFDVGTATAPSLSCVSNGTVEVTNPSGGAGGYTYSYNRDTDFENSNVVSGFSEGNQPVYIKDQNSCVASVMASIPAAPPAMKISSENTIPPSCYQRSDGQYQCIVSNVFGVLSVVTDLDPRISAGNVSINGNEITISGLGAGSYAIKLVDTYKGSSCPFPITFSINDKPAISITSSVTDVTDKGTSTGSVIVNVSGGNEGSRTFSIFDEDNKLVNKVISSLNTITFPDLTGAFSNGGKPYYIDISDVNSCSYLKENGNRYMVRVQEPETKLGLSYNITKSIDCHGNDNASIVLSASGGWTEQYSYGQNNIDWTSDNTFTNISAGSHTFYVTDDKGGKASVEVYVSQPAELTATLDSARNVLCKGTNTGWVRYNVSGGTFPYSFLSQQESLTTIKGNDTLLTAKNLTFKTWAFQIQDKNGCLTSSLSKEVSEPDLLTIPYTSVKHTSCELNNGELFAKAAGGTSPYTYQWRSLDNVFNSSVAGLTMSETSHVISLMANTYNVQVTDLNNCSVTSPLLTIDPYTNPIITDVHRADVKCHDANNGTIQISAQGGTAALASYSLLTNNPVYSNINTTGIFEQLKPDTYFAYVFDNNGCRSNISFPAPIGQPKAPISLVVDSVLPVLGKGTPSGSILSTSFGGNGVLKEIHLFNSQGTCIDSSSQRSEFPFTLDSLRAGKYAIQVKDVKGCSFKTDSIWVQEPDTALRFTVTNKQNARCKSQVGSFTVQGSGGWGGYSYTREDNKAFYKRNTFDNLYAGDYIITVKDRLGATFIDTVLVDEPKDSLRSWVSEALPPTCSNNGELKVGIKGGRAPYTLFSKAIKDSLAVPLAQTVSLKGLAADSYSMHVIDSSGCRFNLEALLLDTAMIRVAFNVAAYPSGANPSGGAIQAFVTGGAKPYTYEWRQQFGEDLLGASSLLKGMPSGHYSLRVIGTDGCSKDTSIYLPGVSDAPFTIAKLGNETSLSAQNGYCKLTSKFSSWKSFDLITPANELLVFNPSDSISLFYCKGDTVSLQNLKGGNYFISGITAGDTTVYTHFTIEPYRLFQFRSINVVNVDTIGGTTGEVVIVVTGGGGGNKFEWSRVSGSGSGVPASQDYPESSTLSGLTSGKYRVLVTDRYGNTIVDTATVEAPPARLSISIAEHNNESCKTYKDANVTLKAEGGWGDYQFRHDNAVHYVNGSFFDTLNVRKHYFYLIDKMGVVDSVAVDIAEPDYLTSRAALVDSVNCKHAMDGRVEFAVNGGTAPYRFAYINAPLDWKPGTVATGVAAGKHYYIFTDDSSCVGQDTVEVNMYEPDSLLFNKIDITHTTCNTDNGAIKVLMQGGTKPYTYAWRNFSNDLIGSDSSVNGLIRNGLYTLDVYDYHNCHQHAEKRIAPSTNPEVTNVDTTAVLCYGGNTGKAFVVDVKPGEPFAPYNFTWSNGDTGKVASGYPKGIHFVTISDTNKCSTVKYFEVTQPDSLRIAIADRKNAHCFGYNDAFLLAEGQGGVGGYAYRWSTGDTTALAKNLYKGIYGLKLTDANKCLTEESFTIDEPAKQLVDLGDDIKMCPGNSRILDGQDFATHKWFTKQGVVSNERYYTAKEANDYYLEVTNSIGCFAWDTLNLSIGNDALKADFLLSSQAKMGDTLSLFELSNIPLDSLQWDYDNSAFSKIGPANPDYVLFLKTLKQGIYNINLYAFSGGCVSVATKQVEIIADTDTLPNDGDLGYKDPLIKSFTISPNPSDGNFYATVELREVSDINLVMFSIVSSAKIDERSEHSLKDYSVGYNLSNLNSGVYLLILKVGSERKQVKIIIQ